MNRSVFNLRVRGFEIQVERLLDNSLREKSMALLSGHGTGALLTSVSKEAQDEGLFEGLKLSLARKMSPRTLFLPHKEELYRAVDRDIFQSLLPYSPLVVKADPGQFFLDMSGMGKIYPNPKEIAGKMRQRIGEQVSLTSHIGIASSRIVSAVAAEIIPEEIVLIPSGEESGFLSPLPCHFIPALKEPETEKLLRYLFIQTIEPIQQLTHSETLARTLFGKNGDRIALQCRGCDDTPLLPPREEPSLLFQCSLPELTEDPDLIWCSLKELCEKLASAQREISRFGRRLRLEIHYGDGFRKSRVSPVADGDNRTLYSSAKKLLAGCHFRRQRVRSLLLEAKKLTAMPRQLSLFDDELTSLRKLDCALDKIQREFGRGALLSLSARKN